MDKKTIVGLVLMLVLVLGFSYYNSNKAKKLNEQKALELAKAQQAAQDSTIVTIKMEPDSLQSDSLRNSSKSLEDTSTNSIVNQAQSGLSPFYVPADVQQSDYYVETEKVIYHFSRKGGMLTYVELKDVYRYTPKGAPKEPLILFNGSDNVMNLELLMANQTPIESKYCYFVSDRSDSLIVSKGKTDQLSLKLYPSKLSEDNVPVADSNSYIEFRYTFYPDNYQFDFDVHFVKMSSYLYMNKQDFTLQWSALLNSVEKNYKYERDITSIFYMDNLDEVNNLKQNESDKEDFSTPLKWISFKQQFFTSIIIADSASFSSGNVSVDVDPEYQKAGKLKAMNAELDFEVNSLDNSEFNMSMYIGPNQYKLLKEYDLQLERQVPLGWGFLLHWINRLAVIPVFNWLESYGLSYGLIILILTVLLKILLFPIAYKTYLSSARMRVLKPEIDEIAEKYKGDSQDIMMKKQQATMSLYKSAGVSPLSGCLPMLLQMPILIALFRFFPSAYELRQQPFLWAEDLSTYDSVWNFGHSIPFYGDHVSLFCLLMTIATLIYTWLNNKMMASTGNNDQMKMMKVFMYIMPIIFLGTFNSFASGLTYYYLLVNLITFIQMFIFRIAVNEDKLRAKMKFNMTKPVKKSKWQQRMDDMMKQQKQMQQQQNRR